MSIRRHKLLLLSVCIIISALLLTSSISFLIGSLLFAAALVIFGIFSGVLKR